MLVIECDEEEDEPPRDRNGLRHTHMLSDKAMCLLFTGDNQVRLVHEEDFDATNANTTIDNSVTGHRPRCYCHLMNMMLFLVVVMLVLAVVLSRVARFPPLLDKINK